MIVDIDTASPTPPFEQLRAQFARMIRAGVLQPGTRLPAIRHLAADLGLAANTVARAYRELESEGLVTSRVRHGTTVTGTTATHPPAEVNRILTEAARAYALLARQLGVPPAAAESAVREQLRPPEPIPHTLDLRPLVRGRHIKPAISIDRPFTAHMGM